MPKKIDPIKRAQGNRLAAARMAAGFKSARAAALENGWKESSYRAHETGLRTIGNDDAERYAKKYRSLGVSVTAQGILFGDQDSKRISQKVGRISLDALMQDESDEEVARAAEVLKLMRRPHTTR
jgi:hypothetical protein